MHHLNDIFSVREVCKRTGLSYKQLDDTARKALVAPSVAVAEGKGSRRLYSHRDIMLLRAVAILRKMGIGRNTFAAVLQLLQSSAPTNNDRNRKYIVVSGSKVCFASDAGLKQLVHDPRNVTILLPLSVLATEDK